MLKRYQYVIFLLFLLCGCQNTRNGLDETNYEKINDGQSNGGYMRLANESPPSIEPTANQDAIPLYIYDFKERWNAISDEQTGDVYIRELIPLANPLHFKATLKNNLEMEIRTLDKKQISEIIIVGTGQTNSDFIKMLTSWWQVLLITNPGTELHEVDLIFSGIGIGPNSSLEDLKDRTFAYGGLTYKVNSHENRITFQANYPILKGGE
jgi:hypothetical protein